MSRIELLPDNLINKIAAGEVLERPSSAVKELVENSLDANAKKIDVFIRNGGKSEITVSDDGFGIGKNDLQKAVLRHATSKLNSNDIANVKTMGFRGEALSSIVSVSNFTLRSNCSDCYEGYEINLLSGNLKHIKPVSQKKGTYVNVKDLFFSTPARLKFLKSENYESLLIKKLIQKFALINFNTEFNLFFNKKRIIRTSISNSKIPKDKFIDRVGQVLGNEFIENSVELNTYKDDLSLTGLLGIPTFNYSNSNNQFIFVNGRIINDKSLNVILKVAYRDLMFHDRFPQLIINIKCPHNWVDVNVHPMKNEVRFEDEKFLKSFIISSVKSELEKIGHRTSNLKFSRKIKKASSRNYVQNDLILKDHIDTSENLSEKKELFKEVNKEVEEFYPLGFAKSQLHQNYIISQTQKGIIIVDQHAAHERIVYEKLKKDFYNNKIQTQILLIPVVIKIETLALENLKDKFSLFKKYGLKMELFGLNSIIVREIPLIISDCNVKKLVESLVHEIINDDNLDSLESEINKICSTMACHGSIRSGREMQLEEMNQLLRKMEGTKFSGQCNHGRPTYVELDLDEIEKLFGRK